MSVQEWPVEVEVVDSVNVDSVAADPVAAAENMTEMTPAFAREVGDRLRDIRRQQHLSLQAVEEQSSREFKASVLGAYERGERVISVLRLQRLANLYSVPVDQLLPRNGSDRRAEEDGQAPPSAAPAAPIRVDLSRLEALVAPERDLLRRYIGMIQIQRGDFNGRLITIRSEDVRALARVFGRDEVAMRARLEEFGIAV